MFMNLHRSRVFFPQEEKNSFLDYPDISAALLKLKETEFIYMMWNGRVYDVQGYDVGLREEHLL
jgi:hypothetical protein